MIASPRHTQQLVSVEKSIEGLRSIIASLSAQYQCSTIVIANQRDPRQSCPMEYTLSIEKEQILYMETSYMRKYRLNLDLSTLTLTENGVTLDLRHMRKLNQKINQAFQDIELNKAKIYGAST